MRLDFGLESVPLLHTYLFRKFAIELVNILLIAILDQVDRTDYHFIPI